jgi:hypothetical protein
MDAGTVEYNAFCWIPAVPKGNGVFFCLLEQSRHDLWCSNENNVISIKETIDPKAFIFTARHRAIHTRRDWH